MRAKKIPGKMQLIIDENMVHQLLKSNCKVVSKSRGNWLNYDRVDRVFPKNVVR